MKQRLYEKFDGSAVTESMLLESSQLFNENYGVWSEQAARLIGKFAQADYLPDDTSCSYVRVTVHGRLAGNAFACRWTYDNKTVCWITQLGVHQEYRERGLAQGLLHHIKDDDDGIYGIMSSHPAACIAAAKSFGRPIMKASPIRHLRDAKLRGNLFNPEDASGLVSSVDTGFWVDHTESLKALVWTRERMDWPLGELLDGHEFLFIIEARRRARFRPRPKSRPKDTPSPQASA